MARTSAQERLEKAKQAKARAEAQIRQAAAKLRAEDRKKDARRKIVLGGAVIGQAAKDPQWVKVLRMAIASMPERDRALFDGWTPPTPEPVKAAGVVIQEVEDRPKSRSNQPG